MLLQAPTSRPGIGWTTFETTITAINRTGSATVDGEVVVLAFDNEDGSVADNNEDGGNDSGFGNFVAISDTYGTGTAGAQLQAGAIFGVVRGIYADDAEGLLTLAGRLTTVLMDGSSTAIAKGDSLIADGGTATKLLPTAEGTTAQMYKILGHALEAVSADSSGAALFDGVAGLGAWFVET